MQRNSVESVVLVSLLLFSASLLLCGRGDGLLLAFVHFSCLWVYTIRSADRWLSRAKHPITIQAEEVTDTSITLTGAFAEEDKTPIIIRPEPQKPFRNPVFSGIPHQVLGIDPNAGSSVIHAAFRFWLKRYHPDHSAQESTDVRHDLDQKTQMIIEAHAALLKQRRSKKNAA